MNLKINPQYEEITCELSNNKYNSLKESIENDGLWNAIIVNSNGIILDGHQRYKACQELNITPKTITKHFESISHERIFVGECVLAGKHLVLQMLYGLRTLFCHLLYNCRQCNHTLKY